MGIHSTVTTRLFIISIVCLNIKSNMDDNFVKAVITLYNTGDWEGIINEFHDYPGRNKVLWVFPSVENIDFINKSLRDLNCERILSVGCGSGLLEWIIMKATGLSVSGTEIDGAWWHCKYAPPHFIPLLITNPMLEQDDKMIDILHNSQNTALLFCYFNDRQAFDSYLNAFSGNVLIIIGPGEGRGTHTDPRPFGDVSAEWNLYKWQEVRKSADFIAIYSKKL